MPIQVDRRAAGVMAQRFDEALELVGNEFEGLDEPRQYHNAFARLLKQDPLQRVRMLGTDQRDLFVPVLREVLPATVAPGGHILDLGAGDGQTFALLADCVPEGTTGLILEPNRGYVADYSAWLATQPPLRAGLAMVSGFEGIGPAEAQAPPDGSVDLVLALHVPYFFPDLPAAFLRMARFLKRGGALCVVVADENEGYTGKALQSFIDAGGDTGDNDGHRAAIAELQRLLAGDLLEVLGEGLPRLSFEMETRRQPSRLYGHALSDLIALSNIAELSGPRYREVRGRREPAQQRSGGGRSAHRGGGAAQGDVERRLAATPLHRPARRQGSGRSR